jgi:hypothetical protein
MTYEDDRTAFNLDAHRRFMEPGGDSSPASTSSEVTGLLSRAALARSAPQPNEEGRLLVVELVPLGIDSRMLAEMLGLGVTEFNSMYGMEIRLAPALVNAGVAGNLLKQSRSGNANSTIFWLRSRAGWNPDNVAKDPAEIANAIRKYLNDINENG